MNAEKMQLLAEEIGGGGGDSDKVSCPMHAQPA